VTFSHFSPLIAAPSSFRRGIFLALFASYIAIAFCEFQEKKAARKISRMLHVNYCKNRGCVNNGDTVRSCLLKNSVVIWGNFFSLEARNVRNTWRHLECLGFLPRRRVISHNRRQTVPACGTCGEKHHCGKSKGKLSETRSVKRTRT
jgi:hypothetical protein